MYDSGERERARAPEDLSRFFLERANTGDVEGVVALYESDASFMDELVEIGFVVLGGPLADEHRVVLAVECESEDEIRATLARDPWSGSHLEIDTIEPWTIRLDSRRARESSAADIP